MIFYDVREFGADPSGINNSTEQINAAIRACNQNGGGTVVVPAGIYITGAVFLKSNVNLQIEPGATLSFVNDPQFYPVVYTRWEGVERECYPSCIYAENAENVSLTGRGVLEGNGKFWWDLFLEGKNLYPRPLLVSFRKCKNVLIEGLTMRNSPSWTVSPLECNGVTIDKITIINPADSPNTDGINPESCQNVHISNCHIDVGDDCIAIKAGTEDTKPSVPCENITITNCTMVHGHGGVVLGSEMTGTIRNVVISNCVFDGTDRGIRLKTRRGRGGSVEDIMVNNVFMNDVICPFVMNMYYYCGPRGNEKFVSDKAPYPVTEETPEFKNIKLSNITARNVHASAGFMYGLSEQNIQGVSIDNMTIEFSKEAKAGIPAMMVGIDEMSKKGFFITNAKNIRLNNVEVCGNEGEAFIIENCENVKRINC